MGTNLHSFYPFSSVFIGGFKALCPGNSHAATVLGGAEKAPALLRESILPWS